jgi:hypothetical protein
MENFDLGAVGPGDDIQAFITSINEKLTSAGARNAELAFGMGCTISIIPIGILLLILYILGLRSWVGISLVVLIGVLLATAISTFLANRARTGAIRQAYRREVEPQIMQYVQDHEIDRAEFQRLAAQVLSPDAPLIKHFAAEGYPAAIREE